MCRGHRRNDDGDARQGAARCPRQKEPEACRRVQCGLLESCAGGVCQCTARRRSRLQSASVDTMCVHIRIAATRYCVAAISRLTGQPIVMPAAAGRGSPTPPAGAGGSEILGHRLRGDACALSCARSIGSCHVKCLPTGLRVLQHTTWRRCLCPHTILLACACCEDGLQRS